MENKEIKFPYKKFIRTIVVLFILLSLSRIYKYYCLPNLEPAINIEENYKYWLKDEKATIFVDNKIDNQDNKKKEKYLQIKNNIYNIGCDKIFLIENRDFIYVGPMFIGTKKILVSDINTIDSNAVSTYNLCIKSVEADYWFFNPKFDSEFDLKPTNTWDTLELSFHFSSNENERVQLRCK